MDKDAFTRYLTVFRHYSDKMVDEIELKLVAENIEQGELRVTDVQLQEGSEVTGTVPATQDILKLVKFSIDETHSATGDNDTYLGAAPTVYNNLTRRFFNVMGRGFETIAAPNVYHEDARFEIITTGLDLTLTAKDDYDFLRIATFYGGYVEEEEKTYTHDSLADNPLNKRYTREFCFSGGKRGDNIELLSSKQIARRNGVILPKGVQRFDVGIDNQYGELKPVIYKNRQRFMALPIGATRINIQFMKYEERDGMKYLVDDGIGFQGLAEFTQWTWGVSKY